MKQTTTSSGSNYVSIPGASLASSSFTAAAKSPCLINTWASINSERIKLYEGAPPASAFRDPRTPRSSAADNACARVYFTLLGNADRIEEAAAALGHAAGFLRRRLARRLDLRTVPQLQFRYDSSVERGIRLSQLIDEAVAADAKRSKGRR